jgi:hypothetical protein
MIKSGPGWPRWHATLHAIDDDAAVEDARKKVMDGFTFNQSIELWRADVLIATLDPIGGVAVARPS